MQIGDENVHRVRALLDEVFGDDNLCAEITVVKTASQSAELIAGTADYVLWYARKRANVKFRNPLLAKGFEADRSGVYRWVRLPDGSQRPLTDEERTSGSTTSVFATDNITSQRPPGSFPVTFTGKTFGPGKGYWKTGELGMSSAVEGESCRTGNQQPPIRALLGRFSCPGNRQRVDGHRHWQLHRREDLCRSNGTKLVQRCLLMATDPGDLVLDPSCGSGTTAYVAEQWGRRWITIDTSRVALALARARIMGARYPYYLLADSPEGLRKEAEVSGRPPLDKPTYGNVRHGFVYERVAHITLKSIANNAEIDVSTTSTSRRSKLRSTH